MLAEWMTALWLRVKALVRRRQLDRDLNDELQFHLAMREEKLREQGVPAEEAHYAARRDFGNATQAKQAHRELWTFPFLETIWQDLLYGLRQLRRNPGFTAVAVITLALGIGANTAVFSLVNAVLLHNLPVPDPSRLALFSDNPSESMSMSRGIPSGRQTQFSYPFYKYVRDNSRLFEAICAFQTPEDTLTVREEGQPSGALQVAQGKMVSGNFFSVLGVRAVIGRTLTPADDKPGAPPVALVSFNYWQRKLAGNPGVVGRTFDVDGVSMMIVGVAPKGFYGVRLKAHYADFWMQLSLRPRLPLTVMPQARSLLTDSNTYWMNMMGRLKPGVTLEQARAEIDSELTQYLAARTGSKISKAEWQEIERAYVPLSSGERGLSQLRYQYAEPLRILLVVAGLVLLIACANVANLMFAHATARRGEMAMRLALGGTRLRIMRQIFTETVLLTGAGALAGAVLSWWSVRVLVTTVASKVPLSVRPDLAVLAFTAGVSFLAVILSGLAPALRATRVELISALKLGSAPGAGKRPRFEAGRALVVFQIAASLLLMVGAGLLVRSLVDLENQNLGFNPEHVLLVSIDPELAGYKSSELPALYHELVDRMNALPGVRSASIGMTSPMSGSQGGFQVSVEGQPQPASGIAPQVVVVGPHYFETEGMKVVAGRAVSKQDTASSTAVAVVNQAFVQRLIPHGSPVGLYFSPGPRFNPPGYEIVGVVQNARFSSVREPAGPMFFLSAFQLKSVMASVNEIEVRVAGDPPNVTAEVRRAVHEIDPNLPVTDVTTLRTQVNDSLGQQRLISGLTSLFGFLGLLLALVGLYGILAYSVVRRTHEIGIRIALGAQKGDVLRMVVRQGMKLSVFGVSIGIAAALALTQFLSSLLYGVKPTDPLTFIIVSLILLGVALLACYIPARRATKVDPMAALRHE